MVYSTNPDFVFEDDTAAVPETLPAAKQNLYLSLDKKQRKGKKVTLLEGFVGNETDLKTLGKKLKSACGSGGSVKDGQILIQGDFRQKVKTLLENEGYKVKLKGG